MAILEKSNLLRVERQIRMSAKVHVMMDFAMPSTPVADEALDAIMDAVFAEDASNESLSDAGFFSNRETATVHLDLMASGANVDEAAAAGIAAIMAAMHKSSASDWRWMATVVTPPEQIARLTIESLAV
jgi:hypothetical protein